MISIMSVSIFDLLEKLSGTRINIPAGANLFHLGDAVETLHIVQTGEVHLVRYHDDGAMLIYQRAKSGSILAEASIYSKVYHCSALVVETTQVFAISRTALETRLQSDPVLALEWSKHLAKEIQQSRLHAEILHFKTVRERLKAWMVWRGELPPKGQWKNVAEEIGVSVEALYREMAKTRE